MPVVDTPEANARRSSAYADYIHDQLQQERAISDHGAVLKSRAPHRIAAMKSARKAAGLSETPSADDSQADVLDHYHVVERMLDEQAFYPPHDKRTESATYAKVHHQMTVADDKRCLVCGVKHSTLADTASNPFGAVQMETHHHTIEWALANAIDPDKFNQHILPGLAKASRQRQSEPGYAAESELYKAFDAKYEQPLSADDIKAWIDHGADNLWVLCDVHHRHKFVGIHAITYPIWGPQDVVNQTVIDDEIAAAKKAGPKANV